MIGQKLDLVDQASELVDEEMGRMKYETKILNDDLMIEMLYIVIQKGDMFDLRSVNFHTVRHRSLEFKNVYIYQCVKIVAVVKYLF